MKRKLRSALTESAHAAARTKGRYLSAHYARIRGRRGSKKAAVAVGHSILVIAYHLLERKVPYEDLGEDYYVRDRRCSSEAHTKRLVRQLWRGSVTKWCSSLSFRARNKRLQSA